MSTLEKAIERIKRTPSDYTYREVKQLLEQFGFRQYNKGKTSGSRVRFFRESDSRIINIHKPHPSDVMSIGAIKDIVNLLKGLGEI